MGIKGLWTLLIPAGNRISIETLSDKRLAIDASIWITQFLKANRDPDTGQVRPAAHLIGFFRRICKLLYHGIQPVFVFDGATPEIKLKELNARRKRKLQWLGGIDDGGEQAAKKMARKLLVSKLRHGKELELSMSLARGDPKQRKSGLALAPGFVLDNEVDDQCSASQVGSNVDRVATVNARKGSTEELTTVIQREETEEIIESSDDEAQLVLFPEDNGEVNLDIQALTSLPPKMRKDVIETAKRELRIKSRKEFMSVASDPIEYSTVQLKSFLKSISLNKQIRDAAKQNMPDAPVSKVGESRNDKQGKSKPETLFLPFAADDSDIDDCWSVENNSNRYDKTKSAGSKISSKSTDHNDEIFEQDQSSMLNNQPILESFHRTREKTLDDDDDYCNDVYKLYSSQREFNSYGTEQEGGFIQRSELETKCDIPDEGGGFIPSKTPSKDCSMVGYMSSVTNLYDEPDVEVLKYELDYRSHLPITEAINEETSVTEAIAWNRKGGRYNSSHNDYLVQSMQFSNRNIDIGVTGADLVYYVDAGDGNKQYSPGPPEELVGGFLSTETSKVIAIPKYEMTVSLLPDSLQGKKATNNEYHAYLSPNSQSSCMENAGKDQSLADEPKDPSASNDYLLDSEDDSVVDWEDGEQSNLSEGTDNCLIEDASKFSGQLEIARKDSIDPVVDIMDANTNLRGLINVVHMPYNQQNANTNYPHIQAEVTFRVDTGHSPHGARLAEIHATESLSQTKAIGSMNGSEASGSLVTKIDTEDTCDSPPEHLPSTIPQTFALTASVPTKNVPLDISLEGLQREEGELRDEWNRYLRDTDFATDEHIDEVKYLIQLFGIPIIQAPAEAEAQCAVMEKMGFVDGVVTEDSDALVFGADTVYKNIFDDKMFVEVYHSNELKKLGISRNELVALAMLLGGDYTDGVKGVGIVNGMEIIKAFPMEESVKSGLSNFRKWLESDEVSFPPGSPQEQFHLKHLSARLRWTTPNDFPSPNVLHAYMNPVVDRSEPTLSWAQPDVSALKNYCKKRMDWPEMETDRLLAPVIKQQKGSRQRTLDSYLMKYDDQIKFAQVRSARLRALWQT